MVGQLVIVITVLDYEQRKYIKSQKINMLSAQPATYSSTFIDMLQTCTEISYKIHGMVEIELSAIPQKSLSKSHNLGKQQIYSMKNIIHNIHVIPATEDKSSYRGKRLFYVNNYIDWNQYTSLYNLDFMNTSTALVNKFSFKLQQEMMNRKAKSDGESEKELTE
ncbi:hypothetical protein CISG_10157 [Coccidioides immitis RMSCC 3703]|uniref:Uncharacterized protein n=1 Tax=Coccidioides immitis RMSCC 3703 TaxID=454286 RepID=A0A0J8QN07_COCIT|nr:hypothetical protein CISG_10157 [Coccidioides immitis RMSCC 3703]